jgi:hypothetical protein
MAESEKTPSSSPPSSSPSTFSFASFNIPNLVPQFLRQYIDHLSDWQKRLGLESPGTLESIHKEVQKEVFLTHYAFSGMKADLGRGYSVSPLFSVQHSFSAGSSQAAPWSFMSMYSTNTVLLPLQRILDVVYNYSYFCKGIWIAIYSSWRDVILLSPHET